MMAVQDDDLLLIHYNSLNRGQHKIIGLSTGQFYGYRGGGTKFYVRRSDIEAQPHIFIPIQETVDATPESAPIPEAPISITASAKTVEPKPIAEAIEGEETKPEESGILDQILSDELPQPKQEAPKSFNMQLIPGVTADIAAQLNVKGAHTMKEIIDLGKEELMTIKGIGEARANTILEYISGRLSKSPIVV